MSINRAGLCTLEGMHDMLASRNLDDLTVKGPTYDASGTLVKGEFVSVKCTYTT